LVTDTGFPRRFLSEIDLILLASGSRAVDYWVHCDKVTLT
jgi:hypothetical protein